MTRWLVTGATGLLGSNALELLRTDGSAIGVARSAPPGRSVPFEALDLSDSASRRGLIARTMATSVLHCAALSSIEAAQDNPLLTHEVNVVAAADLARQASEAGAAFVYISSDAVFDGVAGDYSEESPTSPQSEYGRSKARGEEAVLAANPEALVARVNFYGWSATGRRSLAEFFFNRLRDGVQTPGFADVIVSTLQVGYLVETLRALVAVRVSGVLHVASREPTDKYSFGCHLAQTFGLDPDLIIRARSSNYLQHRRGANLSLDVRRVEAVLGAPMANQRAGLLRLLAEYEAGLPELLRSLNTRKGDQ